jgi:BirA family biotin operon repressor/biotin-[acetyl-CoA-carboxylase] ligase
MVSFFSSEEFETLRAARHVTWGRPVRVLTETTSTNDEALAAVSGSAKTGIVWVTEIQTSGRGRRGNSWTAPPGECLMFSTLLRYVGPAARLRGLSVAAGLAVRDAVSLVLQRQGVHADLKVKWPNDVYANGKKIAGVLVETRPDGAGALGIALGVGLNVKTKEFPEDLPHATSLALLSPEVAGVRFESLLVDVLGALEKRVSVLLARGIVPLLADLQAVDFLLGKRVAIEGRKGIARGVDAGGGLIVEQTNGDMTVVESGHVEVVDGQ